MRSITRSRVLLSGALALGALAAIGGFTPGVGTAEATPIVSPFAGHWSGTMIITDSVDPEWLAVGTLEWTISDVGRITGTFFVETFGHDGRFSGHVGPDGQLMVVMLKEGGGIPHDGTAAIASDGSLVASATDSWSDVPVSVHTWSIVATLDD
jgi:hypothetical protein